MIQIKIEIRQASAGICGTHCTGPNHELTLVMTKERAGVMLSYCRWPVACSGLKD